MAASTHATRWLRSRTRRGSRRGCHAPGWSSRTAGACAWSRCIPSPQAWTSTSGGKRSKSLPAPGSGAPRLLIGDFNATFDQAEFRDLVDRGYRDAGAATGKGLQPTWPSSEVFPWGLMTIDHVLADRRLGVAEYGVDGLPGSDHRAIHARLVLPWR